ncbi:ribonuclease CAF1 [Gigaspora margarita]|uniref:Ribonuclease CAF1 n=1 Tax=Gigaspora margarita TaxID=4874 RepID=A0A8H3XDN9_GIGMA|nr:ribonuclease CAF1 [Gigaspora margarita]
MRPQPPDFTDVTKDNISSLEHIIKNALNRASFIALDTEFTGLGGKEANTRASNIEERYINLCKVVKTHAVVAFGITVFEDLTESGQVASEGLEKQYNVYNFNFTLFSQVDYIMSPRSLQFLSDSGFDFNKQIRRGIPYTPGRDPTSANSNDPNAILRSIFFHILTRNVPIVVHNGFLDLIYIYYSFYAELPEKLSTFIADLTEMFPAGIVDTKYIADYVTREKSSFLAYLFRKYEREQVDHKNAGDKNYLLIRIQKGCDNSQWTNMDVYEKTHTDVISTKRPLEQRYCEQYAMHGFCSQRMRCGNSHDLDFILNEQAKEVNSKRKRRKGSKNQSEEIRQAHMNEESSDNSIEHVSASMPPTVIPSTKPDQYYNYHSAHFDAYMTGFIFARQLMKYTSATVMNEYKNKLYLISKNIPLLVEKSQFSKTSIGHQEKQKSL